MKLGDEKLRRGKKFANGRNSLKNPTILSSLDDFVYKEEKATAYLREIIGWTPRNVIDAKVIAREANIPPMWDSLTNALVGGRFCCRRMNYSSITMPSQTALRHIDINASPLYEFSVK